MANTFPVQRVVLLWMLFSAICFGLGYPILNRYDPGEVPGTSDAADYCEMVRSPLTLSYRIFVPALAKPFYLLARGRINTWDPARFGLLMASSILSASTAIAIVAIGLRCELPFATSLLGAMLFLFDFAVPNWNLSGYIDSGEAFFLAMVIWSLLSERWYLLTIWAIPGGLAKDTFAPFSVVLSLTWFMIDRPLRLSRAMYIVALAVLSGSAVLVSLQSGNGLIAGGVQYTVGMAEFASVGFFPAMLRCITAHEFWMTFAWLLPLGLMRIRNMDRRWLWAASVTFVLALLFGGYNDALGNTTRAFFNIAGPLLSLAAADFLLRQENALPNLKIAGRDSTGLE